jgi:flagellar biosynthesis/type III secretory pathway protein FliH
LVVGFPAPVLAQEKDTVDPEVRQQIEALIAKQDEAFNKSDAAGRTAEYTQDATEVLAWETAGGAATGQQAIEKRLRQCWHQILPSWSESLFRYIQSAMKYAQFRNSSTRLERKVTAQRSMFVS